jgi:hypothetical protein
MELNLQAAGKKKIFVQQEIAEQKTSLPRID